MKLLSNKKKCSLLLVLIIVLLLSACGGNNPTQQDSKNKAISPPEKVDKTQQDYERACTLATNGDYDSAISAFEALGDYRDSSRRADGIRGISAANDATVSIMTQHLTLSLVGMDIYCEYSPENYTFTEVWEFPQDGMFGMISGLGNILGEDISYDETGMQSLAEDIYFEYFFPDHLGIICAVEVRDYANNKTVRGTFSGLDDITASNGSNTSIETLQEYANSRDYVIQDGVLIEYTGSDSTIQIPEGVLAIANDAFAFNTTIISAHMPSTLKSIGDGAFYNCEKLKEIILPDGLEVIGKRAFWGTKLPTIYIPETVVQIQPDEGGYCPIDTVCLKEIHFGGTVAQWQAFHLRTYYGPLKITVYCADGSLILGRTRYESEDEYTGYDDGYDTYNETDISGAWWDTWSQQCNMTITKSDGDFYNVVIHWSNNESNYNEWIFSGYYDNVAGALSYSDGNWFNCEEDEYGYPQEGFVLSNMEGRLYFDESNFLQWDDYTSAAYDLDFGASNMRFEHIAELG